MNYKKTFIPSKISVKNVVTLHRTESKPSRHHIGEAHDFPELVYVVSGENNVMIDGECHVVREGEAIIFAPLSFHCGSEKSSELTLYIISFDLAEHLPDELYNRSFSLTKKQKNAINEIFSVGLELFSHIPPNSNERGMYFNGKGDEASLQIIKNNLELVLLSLIKDVTSKHQNKPTDEKMKVVHFLSRSIEKNLTLEEIAVACSMSTSKLKRLFDGGVISYFNDMKISSAKELIRNTDMNISQIAGKLGFSSIHYFSRLFKSKTGVSPSKFKETAST